VLLGGLADELHKRNVRYLFKLEEKAGEVAVPVEE
jgi:hypothetical protein